MRRVCFPDAARTTIRVVSTDGNECEVPATQLVHLRGDCVAELRVIPLLPSDASSMHAILQQMSMPNLTTLVVGHGDPSVATTAAPLLLDISSHLLPSLHFIQLQAAATTMTPSLASQLRFLEMGVEATVPSLQLQLSPFLECIASFGRLERLNLRNCFERPICLPGPSPSLPFAASRLVDVKITDHPANIREIMSRLIVPASATVLLRANMYGTSAPQCAAGMMDMLPLDRECLPVLRCAEKLIVTSTLEECEVYGGRQDERGSVSLELLTDFERNTDPSAAEARVGLFQAFLHNLPRIFPASAATHLTFTGPLRYLAEHAWLSALTPFSNLRRLTVDEEQLRSFPDQLFTALLRRSPTTSAVICTKLDHLELYGDIEDWDARLRTISMCLEKRRKHGGRDMLRNLTVELYSDEPLPAGLLERSRGKFSELAIASSLKNHVVYGHRTR